MRWIDSVILRKATAKRRVEGHDAVFTQPHHETGRVVSTQVVQHQEETQGRHVLTDTGCEF
jgi:hypothetical protein